jgi:anionic cell wall polymer biosynthesis LytR-Cps2A-Psr (LCP) family protein
MRQPGPRIAALLTAALIVTSAPEVLAQGAPAPVTGPPVIPVAAAASTAGAASLLGGVDVAGLLGDLRSTVVDGMARQVADAVTVAASNPCSGKGSTLKKTSNGSLPVLLLGSDYRNGAGSERTDSVIVMNVARNGRVAMAAIPRDTVQIPLAGGGTSGASRVNALYQRYKRSSVGRKGVDCKALDRVRRDIAKTLGTQIPYYAFIRMDEFATLINSIGGIRMNVRYTLIDDHYRRKDRKIYVPKSTGYKFNGSGKCGPRPKLCRNALKYARSRYGTEGGAANNDFRRARRQQEVVFWAGKTVVGRGNGARLSNLLAVAKSRIWTNLPKNAGGARAIYAFVRNARFAQADGKVFGPSRWASKAGTYTYRLRLSDVRQWVDNHFKP